MRRYTPHTETGLFHVVNRGARKLPIYGDSDDCRSFINLLRDASTKTDSEIHAYALMPNHFHLVVRDSADGLAELMRVLQGVHARRFNRKYRYDGPLFRGPYRLSPITTDEQLIATIRYVHRNPFVELGDHPMLQTKRWTSHAAYLQDGRESDWVQTDLLLALFDGDRNGYRQLMDHGPDRFAGLKVMVDSAPRVVSLQDVERAVGIDSPTERAAVAAGGRGVRNTHRLLALLIGAEFTDSLPEQLAARFGYNTTSSMRSAASRGRDLSRTDAKFRLQLNQSKNRLPRRWDD